MITATTAPAHLDIDPFSLEFLGDPHAYHAQLRDAGAVVRLDRYGIWGMARHAEVSAALQDWQTFCSGRGGGLADFAKEKPWRPPSIILEADPPLHSRTRGVLASVLSRPALARLSQTMEQHAEALLDEVLQASNIDAIPALAQAFPLRVFPDALGVVRDGRENLLPYGDMVFNAFGPRNALFEASMQRASEVIAWIVAQCQRQALNADGFGAQIYAHADAGTISEAEAGLLVRSLLTAGLDTTIHGIGHALHCFARFPEQWQVLRADPKLLRNAFDEVLRWASPVQTFFRTTTKAVEVSGTQIPEGEKVLLFLAAANRDPRRWDDAESFNIRREVAGHVAFGHGIHQCVGQMVARMEAEALLGAMLKRVESFELASEPVVRPNNTLRGLRALPIKIRTLSKRAALANDASVLNVLVQKRIVEANGICSYELVDPQGRDLPAFAAGSHIDVSLDGDLKRQYSLCNDPSERHRYRIAVLREPTSRGGSKAMHENVHEGKNLRISAPRNHFSLSPAGRRSLLLAGGIGVTPILAMAAHLGAQGADFEMHYCARSSDRMAFREHLQAAAYASKVHLHLDDGIAEQKLDLERLLGSPQAGTHIYVCGPKGFMDAVLGLARTKGWPEEQLHYEFFAGEVVHAATDAPFEVQLASSGRTILIPKDRTVAEVLLDAGVNVSLSCAQGVCGTCLTRVIEGVPDHRDLYLTPEERAANDCFTPCCSRSRTARLVIDL